MDHLLLMLWHHHRSLLGLHGRLGCLVKGCGAARLLLFLLFLLELGERRRLLLLHYFLALEVVFVVVPHEAC